MLSSPLHINTHRTSLDFSKSEINPVQNSVSALTLALATLKQVRSGTTPAPQSNVAVSPQYLDSCHTSGSQVLKESHLHVDNATDTSVSHSDYGYDSEDVDSFNEFDEIEYYQQVGLAVDAKDGQMTEECEVSILELNNLASDRFNEESLRKEAKKALKTLSKVDNIYVKKLAQDCLDELAGRKFITAEML